MENYTFFHELSKKNLPSQLNFQNYFKTALLLNCQINLNLAILMAFTFIRYLN